MATYILTKQQKLMVGEALQLLLEQSVYNRSEDYKAEDIVHLKKYIDEPYSGSWMGKNNIR